MASYIIKGPAKIQGEIKLHGAKNAALPILSAALLGREMVIENCPRLSDVEGAIGILTHLGAKVQWLETGLSINTRDVSDYTVPEKFMGEMRSSIIFLGAIIARCGRARMSYPGGCEIGLRPIDMHLEALRNLGVVIREEDGYLDCSAPNGLKGADITLGFPSVGATENTMIAACVATGETVIRNAAREPEIVDLAKFLVGIGYKVKIRGDGSVIINGVGESVDKFYKHRVIPDRIACATYLGMAAITGGEIRLIEADYQHIASITPIFQEMGCQVNSDKNSVSLVRKSILKPAKIIRTMPYPGFPTDAQSPLMAVSTVAKGTTVFVENIFESRYKHIPELIKMGSRIRIEGKVAIVEGVNELHSATVRCTDLRGGAALTMAALVAKGSTKIDDVKHIQRGYDNFVGNLQSLGVNIEYFD